MGNELDGYRQEIDRIDVELLRLINERASVAAHIGAAKKVSGGSIFVPHREAQVFERIGAANPGPLPDRALRAIWREIMSAAIALEQPLTICHFGRPGAFTHLASRLKFGESASYTGVEAISTVFKQVERGHADYGVVPIENSIDGGITDTIDAFLDTHLRIVNELHLRIRHHLMACCDRQSLRRIYSKYTVFSQCRRWLAENLPQVELVEVGSTTAAAERAASEVGAGAIGNADAAGKFGLAVLAEDIEDDPTNTTRFVVLATADKAAASTGNDKTSLMFGVKDRPGALYDALVPFHKRGLSLSRIESRPSRRQAWEYLFFIDLVGHVQDAPVREAVSELEVNASILQLLGSYPKADRPLNS